MTTIFLKEGNRDLANADIDDKAPQKDITKAITEIADGFAQAVTVAMKNDVRHHKIGIFAKYDDASVSDIFYVNTEGNYVDVEPETDSEKDTGMAMCPSSDMLDKDMKKLGKLIAPVIRALVKKTTENAKVSFPGARPITGITRFLYNFYDKNRTSAVIYVNDKPFYIDRRDRLETNLIEVRDECRIPLIKKRNLSDSYPKRMYQLAQIAQLIILCSTRKDVQGFYLNEGMADLVGPEYMPQGSQIKAITRFASSAVDFIADRTDFMREEDEMLLVVPNHHQYLHIHTEQGKLYLYDAYGQLVTCACDRESLKTDLAHGLFDVLAAM